MRRRSLSATLNSSQLRSTRVAGRRILVWSSALALLGAASLTLTAQAADSAGSPAPELGTPPPAPPDLSQPAAPLPPGTSAGGVIDPNPALTTPETPALPPVEAPKHPTDEAPKPEDQPKPEAEALPVPPADTPSEPAPEIAVDPDAARRAEATTSVRGKNPAFQSFRPSWALGLTISPDALGASDINPAQNGASAMSFELEFDYQPAILQAAGVFDVGVNVGVYPMVRNWFNPSTDPNLPDQNYAQSSPTLFSNWKAGVVARYQARYFREQPVVPVVGYYLESLAYNFSNGPAGRVALQGPSFGLMLNLNFLEPSQAAENYVTNGVTRSYLLVEARMMSGSNAAVSVSGTSYFFGLRIEL